jgi:hypothetical protein
VAQKVFFFLLLSAITSYYYKVIVSLVLVLVLVAVAVAVAVCCCWLEYTMFLLLGWCYHVCSFVYGVMTAEETKCHDILISYNKVIVFLVAVGLLLCLLSNCCHNTRVTRLCYLSLS